MRYLKILILLAAFSFIFVSCSEDDDGPTGNNDDYDNYFEMGAGSYWITDNYDVNKEGNIEESYTRDSTVVTEISEYDGKESYEMETYSDGEYDEDSHFSEDDNAVYIRAEYLLPEGFDIGIDDVELPEGWITFYDKNLSNWTLVEEVTAEDIEFEDYTVDITFSMNAEKNGSESLTIDGKSVTADKMLMITDIEAKIMSVPINISLKSHFYFVKGYGLVKVYTEPVEKDLVIDKIIIDGYVSETVKMEMK